MYLQYWIAIRINQHVFCLHIPVNIFLWMYKCQRISEQEGIEFCLVLRSGGLKETWTNTSAALSLWDIMGIWVETFIVLHTSGRPEDQVPSASSLWITSQSSPPVARPMSMYRKSSSSKTLIKLTQFGCTPNLKIIGEKRSKLVPEKINKQTMHSSTAVYNLLC